jgi:hypothetical protein
MGVDVGIRMHSKTSLQKIVSKKFGKKSQKT